MLTSWGIQRCCTRTQNTTSKHRGHHANASGPAHAYAHKCTQALTHQHLHTRMQMRGQACIRKNACRHKCHHLLTHSHERERAPTCTLACKHMCTRSLMHICTHAVRRACTCTHRHGHSRVHTHQHTRTHLHTKGHTNVRTQLLHKSTHPCTQIRTQSEQGAGQVLLLP